MALIAELCERKIGDAATFPMTYTYAGTTYRALPADTRKSVRRIDSNIIETVYTASVPASDVSLRVECVTYRDFPVVEWTAYFTNEGNEKSEILEDVWAADLILPGKSPVLQYGNGDFFSEDGYTQREIRLTRGTRFSQAPSEGRACNEAWPYQRLLFDGFGMNLVIGWPAQWESVYDGLENAVAFKARQQTVHTYLLPGETLRTPRMCVMAFEGGEERGVNLWRRFMNAHVTPKAHGDLVPCLCTASESGPGDEHTLATDEIEFEAMEKLAKWNWGKNVLWWIDAGWYPCYTEPGVKRWAHTGTWMPDRRNFPCGMGRVGDKAHEMGIRYLNWFEPERVRPGTELALEHPEWLLSATLTDEMRATATDANQYNDDNFMLNLADDACCDWVCQRIDSLVKDARLDVYRQDFNFSPLPYWRDNEAEDRKGWLENKYQQNYLRFWDYLLRNNPGLWIDSCSSGGRRNDLETMRRAVPLHPTDYGYGYHPLSQDFRRTMSMWIPYTRGQTGNWLTADNETYAPQSRISELVPGGRKITNYELVTGMAALLPLFEVSGMESVEGQPEYVAKMIRVWERFAPTCLRGDFYPLTPAHRDSDKWTVFQFDRPEEGHGAFQVLRNTKAMDDSITVHAKALDPKAEYLMEDGEFGTTYTATGAQLMAGTTFTQPRPSGSIWFYTKKA